MSLLDYEDELMWWIHNNHPKFIYSADYFHIVKLGWICDCTYEETFNCICKSIVFGGLND